MKILKAFLNTLFLILCGVVGMICGQIAVTYLPVIAQMVIALVSFGIISWETYRRW